VLKKWHADYENESVQKFNDKAVHDLPTQNQ
jgi:hypothetical protein